MRKTVIITIQDEGRDKGKIFILTELPAVQAEKWAYRALLALARSGVEIPPNLAGAGFAGIAILGFQALAHIDFNDLEPLLDEMMSCIQYRPDPSNVQYSRPLMVDDIEEIATRIKLRAEVYTLHTGFSLPGTGSTSSILTPMPTPGVSSQPKIVRPRLQRSSQPAKQL